VSEEFGKKRRRTPGRIGEYMLLFKALDSNLLIIMD
jgi:hypothetical protein